jgi:ankyrin repeat protein
MRTFATCVLSFALFAGCTNNSRPHAQLVPRNSDNTWTSDALQRGDIAAIQKRVLDNSNYIHERDYVGDTPLLGAIAFDSLELVRFLLEHGADPNIEVDDGYTCLLTAIESDAEESIPIVAELIRAGADIHVTGTNGWTPLHMAAARGHVEKARLLLNAGADVNRRKDIDASETPLMEAAFTGQPSTIALLLEHGADPTMRDTINDRTPLEIAENAAKGPDPDVVNYLANENIQIDVDELFGDMDLPADQLEMMKQTMKEVDMTQSYVDNSNELVKTGNHAEVIRILTEHRR